MLFKDVKIGEFFYNDHFDEKIMRIEDIYPTLAPDDEDKRPINAVLIEGRWAGTLLTLDDEDEVTKA